jgi:hypothetical protein
MDPAVFPEAIPIDSLADLSLRVSREAAPTSLTCDACDETIEGEPEGRGLYVWRRGEEFRIEEPPLCAKCATAIALTARELWSIEEEEG